MDRYKKWFTITLGIMLLPLLIIGGFNFYIDPLWNFSHSSHLNSIQQSFDERQQKTNRLTFSPVNYNTLILGSSRTTYISQYDFIGHQAFNYAVSNMVLEDFHDYIEYAKVQHGGEFDYIILGLDFYMSNKNLEKKFKQPDYYIKQSRSFAYRYKTLLSLDTLRYSQTNYKASRLGQPQNFAYDRHNQKTLNLVQNPQEKADKIAATLAVYQQDIYANYAYHDVRGRLQQLKDSNPNTCFIVFITPVAQPLFELLIDQGLLPYYQQWLRDCVAVFGSVYNFMYPNSITRDLTNFYDASHVYPHIGTLMAYRLVNYPDPRIPKDFGMLITNKNLEQHLAELIR